MDDDGTDGARAPEDGPGPPPNPWPGQQPHAAAAPVASPPAAPAVVHPQPGWQPGWPAQTPGGPAVPGIAGFSGGPPTPPGGWPAHVLQGDRPGSHVKSHTTRNAILGCLAVVLIGAAVITFGVIQTNKKPKPPAYAQMSPFMEVQAVAKMCQGGAALPDGPAYTRGGKDQWAVYAGVVGYGDVLPLDLHEVNPDGPAPESTKTLRTGMAVCVTAVQHLVTRQCELDVGFNQDHFAIDTSVGFDLRLLEVRTGTVLHTDHFVVTEDQCPAAVRITQSGQPVDPYSDDIIADAKTKAMLLAHSYDLGH